MLDKSKKYDLNNLKSHLNKKVSFLIKLFSNPLGDLYREQQKFFCSVWCFCHAFCVLYVIVWYFQNCSHELLMSVVINSCLAVEFLQPLRYVITVYSSWCQVQQRRCFSASTIHCWRLHCVEVALLLLRVCRIFCCHIVPFWNHYHFVVT